MTSTIGNNVVSLVLLLYSGFPGVFLKDKQPYTTHFSVAIIN